jgi:predicted ABC-type ATPase
LSRFAFSDPVGDKLAFLKEAAKEGYTVVLCFIGLGAADVSEQRVSMRVSQGGHNVSTDKLVARFPRTLVNLAAAIREFPHVHIFDNDDLRTPFSQAAVFESGHQVALSAKVPKWLAPLLASDGANRSPP